MQRKFGIALAATSSFAVLALVALAAPALAQVGNQCVAPGAPGHLDQSLMKTVVVNDQDVLRKSGNFTLARTLGKILATSPGGVANDTAENRKNLLATFLKSFGETKLTNEDSGLTFTVVPRPGEAGLKPEDLLDPAHPDGMQIVGVFNRFDLAPATFAYCGEHRLVYAKNPRPAPDTALNRFFIIFEAALRNPDPDAGAKGCKPVAQFWDDLQSKSGAALATDLAKFFFDGLVAGGVRFAPVTHVNHFGIPFGQVRANAFIPPGADGKPAPWHLRQWKVELDKTTSKPQFVADGVSENPVPGLYGGTMPAVEPKADFRRLRGEFQNEFVSAFISQLTVIDTNAAMRGGNPVDELELIGRLGFDIDDRYYAMESVSGPQPGDKQESDDPTDRVNAANTKLNDRIAAKLDDDKLSTTCALKPEHILNRAGVLSCGGCHQFSFFEAPGSSRPRLIAPGVVWPKSLGFVQINESSALSEALTDWFLPFRQQKLKEFLKDTKIFVASAEDGAGPSTDATTTGLRNLDMILANLSLDGAQRAAALQALKEEVRTLRKSDRRTAGAFVTYRRPH